MIKKPQQQFDFVQTINDWEEEWVGMPEFRQNNCEPVQKITINFETEEDVEKFRRLTNLKITNKTKSSWFPFKEKQNMKRWVFEDEK